MLMVVLQPIQGADTVLEVPSFFRLLINGNRQCMYKAIMLAYSKEINVFHNFASLSQFMINEFDWNHKDIHFPSIMPK